VSRDSHELSNAVQGGLQAASTFRKFPRDAAYPNPIEPTFEHCWLRTPPCGIDEHDGVAPDQVLEIGLKMSLGRRRFEMGSALGEGQSRIEGFAVQISDPNNCTSISDPSFHSMSQGMAERIRIGVRVNDEAILHILPTACRTLSRNCWRRGCDCASNSYMANQVVFTPSPVQARRVRVIVRRPLSLMIFTYHQGEP
jgi:hypothetical protein